MSEFKDSTRRKLPNYLLTRDGFTMLAMGLAGRDANLFKELYINKCNARSRIGGWQIMKCPLRIDSQGNASDCYKDECSWWVIDAEIEGSYSKGACAVLEVAVNGIFVTIGDDEEE